MALRQPSLQWAVHPASGAKHRWIVREGFVRSDCDSASVASECVWRTKAAALHAEGLEELCLHQLSPRGVCRLLERRAEDDVAGVGV